MAKRKKAPSKPHLSRDTFRGEGITGKVLEAISIDNDLEGRTIALEFQDKTELTIRIDIQMAGKLELNDWSTGDERLIRRVGLIPDDTPLWRRRMIE